MAGDSKMRCAFCGGPLPPKRPTGPRATYCGDLCKWRARNRRRHPPPPPDPGPITLDEFAQQLATLDDLLGSLATLEEEEP